MENLQYIEDYFTGTLSPNEVLNFEEKISGDPLFADEVAFYLSAIHAVKEESNRLRKERFRALPIQHKEPAKIISFRRMSIAAAVIFVTLVSSIYFFTLSSDPVKLADNYIKTNLSSLSVTMSTTSDSLQKGIDLYNRGSYPQALTIFRGLSTSNPSSPDAMRYAGLAALQNGNYLLATEYFTRLEEIDGLYSNPGKFYRAITLLKRNGKGDKQTAQRLLNEVIDKDLEGASDAKKILDSLD